MNITVTSNCLEGVFVCGRLYVHGVNAYSTYNCNVLKPKLIASVYSGTSWWVFP